MNVESYYTWSLCYDKEQKELDVLKKLGALSLSSEILEVGCGTGRLTARLANGVNKIVAIDPDGDAIAFCKMKYSFTNVLFYQSSLEDLVCQKKFDYVIYSWSMYLIKDKENSLFLAKSLLKKGGKIIVLQANSGEYESNIAKLYSKYDSLARYGDACNALEPIMEKIFGNVSCETLLTHFSFSDIEDLVARSLFFIEDEEGFVPSSSQINSFKNDMAKYKKPDDSFHLTDIVSVFYSEKKD